MEPADQVLFCILPAMVAELRWPLMIGNPIALLLTIWQGRSVWLDRPHTSLKASILP